MASTSSDIQQKICQVKLLGMDGKELDVKLNVTYPVNAKLHLFFLRVKDFVFGERDEAQPPLEIRVVNDAGEDVVLKEHLTPKQCWGAKQNREYYMFAREVPQLG